MKTVCPHCEHGINLDVDDENLYTRDDAQDPSMGDNFIIGTCPLCSNVVILWQSGLVKAKRGQYTTSYEMKEVKEQTVIFPKNFTRSVAKEIPEPYKSDFLEACAVLPISPRASAALSRRLLPEYFAWAFQN